MFPFDLCTIGKWPFFGWVLPPPNRVLERWFQWWAFHCRLSDLVPELDRLQPVLSAEDSFTRVKLGILTRLSQLLRKKDLTKFLTTLEIRRLSVEIWGRFGTMRSFISLFICLFSTSLLESSTFISASCEGKKRVIHLVWGGTVGQP